ncbi:CDC27 family protein [Streptomyces sp. CA-278952]|uniref:CDC27 family protein n=1 Tax=unclassified Streptomyces TaxID=2593676 RepID=UPI0022424D66|nr:MULTISPECIES: CDC27 family protein [unclassified Streptomyces]UZI33450.1 CDC27 family protein [Streptomyces sp. VB1]WDG33338.1 CDC27 family protein [Streptomyces sp. CA-278952]
MNIDDLEWQADRIGGVPPRVVDSLLEHGHVDLVARAAAERGDWFCAQGAVRALQAAGEFERAWAVMKPFAETGWLPAVSAGVDILLASGRVEEALALTRPVGEESSLGACEVYAETLVKCGRVDEAITFLEPHLRDRWTMRCLVAMTEGQGRDARVLELLVPLADEARHHQTQGCSHPLWEALDLQAEVLERSGQVEEAIRVLGGDVAARRYGPQNTVQSYAQLLARHGRVEELQQAATGGHAREAFRPLMQAFTAAGRAQDAEEVLRRHIATARYPSSQQGLLMEFLIEQGRFEEAITVGRPTFEDPWESPLQGVVFLLAEKGLHDRALQLLDECSPEFVAERGDWIPSNRWWLMGELGRCREAITEIEATPELDAEERACTIAGLMARDSRLAEAISLLAEHPGRNATADRAHLLARQNRPLEALAAIPSVAAQREEHEQRWGTRKDWVAGAEDNDGGSSKEDHEGHVEDPPF